MDTEIGGRVVGAACWHTYLTNPYVGERRAEAEWWGDGMCVFFREGGARWKRGDVVGKGGRSLQIGARWANVMGIGEPREFANRLLECLLRDRWEKMARPHMRTYILFYFRIMSIAI